MKILFQTNNRSEIQLEHEYKKLQQSGFEVVPYGYVETTPTTIMLNEEQDARFSSAMQLANPIRLTGLEDLSPTDPVIARVCIPLIRKIYGLGVVRNVSTNFLSSIKYNPHNFTISTLPSNDNFLNKTPGKFELTMLIQVLDLTFNCDMLIKPDNDLKRFSGTIVPTGKTLREVLEEKNELQTALKYPVETVLISNNIVEIEEEIRCYVVNKKVVTLSRYRKDNKYDVSDLKKEDQEKYSSYAQSIIDNVYAPSLEFTIDVAQLKNKELKVVEYNCLNASGLYECDTKALFTALKEYHYPEN